MPALILASAGFMGGIVLFMRGLLAYRRDRLISAVATSSLASIAAGEVRVSGIVEAIGQTLVSPLRSRPCVWYRARVEESGEKGRVLLAEERALGFRIADESGTIRVLPQGARWEIDPVLEGSTSMGGDGPSGLQLRAGPGLAPFVPDDPDLMTESQRQAAIEALLTVKPPAPASAGALGDRGVALGSGIGIGSGSGHRYSEACLEPGEVVTVIGQALPWSDVHELVIARDGGSNVERAIAEDIAVARAAGHLVASPDEAWGNAAILGFGIGRPTRPPDLDPEAHPPELSDTEAETAASDSFDIPDEDLVLTGGRHGPLAIYAGAPLEATTHHDFAFAVGILGAGMAVLCALGLGAILSGGP